MLGLEEILCSVCVSESHEAEMQSGTEINLVDIVSAAQKVAVQEGNFGPEMNHGIYHLRLIDINLNCEVILSPGERHSHTHARLEIARQCFSISIKAHTWRKQI